MQFNKIRVMVWLIRDAVYRAPPKEPPTGGVGYTRSHFVDNPYYFLKTHYAAPTIIPDSRRDTALPCPSIGGPSKDYPIDCEIDH